jgi:hypothetical protein
MRACLQVALARERLHLMAAAAHFVNAISRASAQPLAVTV